MNDILFYSAYTLIVLGTIIPTGIMIYHTSWETLIIVLILPWCSIPVFGPSMLALIINTILRKLYNNHLSGTAVLLASLVFCFDSIWLMLSILPALKGMFGMAYLFAMPWVTVWYILTLTVVLCCGWIVKYLKDSPPTESGSRYEQKHQNTTGR